MGEYVHCRLTMGGNLRPVPAEAIVEVVESLIENGTQSTNLPELDELLHAAQSSVGSRSLHIAASLMYYASEEHHADAVVFELPEVNYGQMPTELRGALHSSGLSWVWEADSADGEGQSVTMYNADTGDITVYPMSGWDLCMPLYGATLKDFARALKWMDWYQKLHLYSHENPVPAESGGAS